MMWPKGRKGGKGMEERARTDLALEAVRQLDERLEGGLPAGVRCRSEEREGCVLTVVNVDTPQGAKELCKPIGEYVTLELDGLRRREEGAFGAAARLLAECLRPMLEGLGEGPVLVVGLGNRFITPDAVGPETMRYVVVTRHLKQRLPGQFGSFRSVCALAGGVLGATGVESSELISALAARLQPCAVVAVDALAASDARRLCRTVQITDTGITPGSGVGNSRAALNRESLGLPVIALGVPTVVDASRPEGPEGLILTPRDIDSYVRDVSRLVGYGLDLALHPGLSLADIDMLVG